MRSVRLLRRFMPVTDDYRGPRLFVKEDGVRAATPFALVVMAVFATDVVFAVDSVPAVYGITGDPFLVFATNAFALLGLRALYFVLQGALSKLVHLGYGLAAILGFIGVKLVLHWAHGIWTWVPEIPTLASLGVIVAILALVTATSLAASRGGAPRERRARRGPVRRRAVRPSAVGGRCSRARIGPLAGRLSLSRVHAQCDAVSASALDRTESRRVHPVPAPRRASALARPLVHRRPPALAALSASGEPRAASPPGAGRQPPPPLPRRRAGRRVRRRRHLRRRRARPRPGRRRPRRARRPGPRRPGRGRARARCRRARTASAADPRSSRADPAVAYAEPNWTYTPPGHGRPTRTSRDGRLWGVYGDTSLAGQPVRQPGRGGLGERAAPARAASTSASSTRASSSTTPTSTPTSGRTRSTRRTAVTTTATATSTTSAAATSPTATTASTTAATAARSTTTARTSSGTIAGEANNGAGVAGVTWSTKLISGKFLGRNGGSLTAAVQAVDYFTDLKKRHGLNIVATNNSWGGGGYSQALYDAIGRANTANILFVAAAGNSGTNNDTTASLPVGLRPRRTSSRSRPSTRPAAWRPSASTARRTVDIGAPGVDVWSTTAFNTYSSYNGTSMATPHVTGAAALYAASHPGATAAQIKAAILEQRRPDGVAVRQDRHRRPAGRERLLHATCRTAVPGCPA